MPNKARKYIAIDIDAREALAKLKKIEGHTRKSEAHLDKLGKTVRRLGGYFATWAVYKGVTALSNLVDTARDVEARLLATSKATGGASEAFRDLLKIGNELGVRVENLAAGYAKLSLAVPHASHAQLTKSMETMSYVLSTTGASVQQVNAVLLQMGQGLSSAALQGDEFRSVNENAPVLLRAWAKAIGKADVGLRDLSKSASFTTKSWIENLDAIRKISEEMIRMEKPPITMGRALTVLRNQAIALFMELESGGSGVFSDFAQYIRDASLNLREMKPAITNAMNILSGFFELMKAGIEIMSSATQTITDFVDIFAKTFSDDIKDAADGTSLLGYAIGVELPVQMKMAAEAAKLLWKDMERGFALIAATAVLAWDKIPPNFAIMVEKVKGMWGGWNQWMLNTGAEAIADYFNNYIDMADKFAGLFGKSIDFRFDFKSLVQLKTVMSENSEEIKKQEGIIADLEDQYGKLADTTLVVAASERSAAEEAVKLYRTKLEDQKLTQHLVPTMRTLGQVLGGGGDEEGGGGDPESVAGGASAAAAALAKLNKLMIEGRADIKEYLGAQKEQIKILQMSDKAARAYAISTDLMSKATEHNTKADVEAAAAKDKLNQINEVSGKDAAKQIARLKAQADGHLKLAEAHKTLAKEWEDAIPLAIEQGEQIHMLENRAASLAEMFTGLGDAMVSSFQSGVSDVIMGMLDGTMNGAEDFVKGLKNTLLKGLADIAAQLLTQPIQVMFQGIMGGMAGGGGGGMGGLGSMLSGLLGGGNQMGAGGMGPPDVNGLGNGMGLSSMFGGSSMGSAVAGGITKFGSMMGMEFGKGFSGALNSLAGTSNMMLGAGGIIGGFMGNMLFGGKGMGGIGSGLGSSAGALIGSAILPGVGTIIGGMLGGMGGGLLGSMFGGSEGPRLNAGMRDGYLYDPGDNRVKMTDQELDQLMASVGAFNDTMARILSTLPEDAKNAVKDLDLLHKGDDPSAYGDVLAGFMETVVETIGESITGMGGIYKDLVEQTKGDVDALLAGLDAITMSFDILEAFTTADPLGDYLAMLENSSRSTIEVISDIEQAIYDLGDPTTVAELDQLVQLVGDRYAAEMKMLEEIAHAVEAITQTVANAREQILLANASDQQIYEYQRQKANGLIEALETATDPMQIGQLGTDAVDALLTAFNTLPEDLQEAEKQTFLGVLDYIENVSQDRLALAAEQSQAQLDSLQEHVALTISANEQREQVIREQQITNYQIRELIEVVRNNSYAA